VKKPILIVFIILFLDQFLKIWIKTHLSIGDSIPVLGNWFYLHFIENEGMAYGWKLFGGGSFGKISLSLFRLIAIGGISYYLYLMVKERKPKLFILSISLILAGAMGNLIDSLFYGIIFNESTPFQVATLFPAEGGYAPFMLGHVVDMFYFPIIEGFYPQWFPWFGGEYYAFFQPVFNIADASITSGVILLLLFQRKAFDTPKAKSLEDEEEEFI